jgi:hypothetical protein
MEDHLERFSRNNSNIFVKSKDFVIGIILGIYTFFALFFKSLIYSTGSGTQYSSNQNRGGQGRPGGSNSGRPENFGGGCFRFKGMGGG